MNREQAKQEIKNNWRPLLTKMTGIAKRNMNGEKSYICPLCGHGKSGDGLTFDKTSRDGNTLKCFGCGFSGDIIALTMQYYNSDYNETVKALSEELSIKIDSFSEVKATRTDSNKNHDKNTIKPDEKEENSTEQQQEDEIIDLTDYYDKCAVALSGSPAMSYLESRGIDENTAKIYHLGYDASADPAQSGYKMPRLIIPVNQNHYIARRLDDIKEYKALNNKNCRPGLFNERSLYSGKRNIFIVEGWADAISIEMCGVSAVALNSTQFADKLIRQLELKPTDSTMIIALDNDQAGKKATEVLKNGFKRLNIPCIEADITGSYKDPNEAINGNMDEFARRIVEAENAAEYERNRDELTDFLEKVQTDAYKPYETGLKFFDNLLGGGIIQQSLLLLMAAPGTGKTTLCQQLSEEMAARKKQVIYLNLEMSREQMLAKAISGKTARKGKPKTAIEILQGYNWSNEEKQAISDIISDYRKNIFPYMKYNPAEIGNDLDSIIEYLNRIGKQAKEKGEPAPAVIIDYLHLISSNRGIDIQELIKQAVTGLKNYAKEYDTFVIGIVATNRASNSGQITMDSGRDSSNIEYTGDYILSLNYYDIDNGTVKASEVEKISELQQQTYRRMIIRVLKGRFVTPGKSANVYFNAAHNTFYGENDFIPADSERIPFSRARSTENSRNRR